MWFKFGGAGLKVLPSLAISLGFEDRVTFRRPVARTDYESRLMAANMSPSRLQERGVEDQLELAKVLRLRLAKLGFEELKPKHCNFTAWAKLPAKNSAGQWTQQANGSWNVKGTKFKKKDRVEQTSIYWGTTWASLALISYLPE